MVFMEVSHLALESGAGSREQSRGAAAEGAALRIHLGPLSPADRRSAAAAAGLWLACKFSATTKGGGGTGIERTRVV